MANEKKEDLKSNLYNDPEIVASLETKGENAPVVEPVKKVETQKALKKTPEQLKAEEAALALEKKEISLELGKLSEINPDGEVKPPDITIEDPEEKEFKEAQTKLDAHGQEAINKRMAKISGKQKAEMERANRLAQENELLKREIALKQQEALKTTQTQEIVQPIQTGNKPPDLKDYASKLKADGSPFYEDAYTAWQKDLIRFERQEYDREKQREAENERLKSRQVEMNRKEAEFRETVSDYQDVANSPAGRLLTSLNANKQLVYGHILSAITETADPVELIYRIAKNPDLVNALTSMSPIAATIKIGELAGKLADSKKANPTKIIHKQKSPEVIKTKAQGAASIAPYTQDVESGEVTPDNIDELEGMEFLKVRGRT